MLDSEVVSSAVLLIVAPGKRYCPRCTETSTAASGLPCVRLLGFVLLTTCSRRARPMGRGRKGSTVRNTPPIQTSPVDYER